MSIDTKFGRFQIVEPEENLLYSHQHDGSELREVSHEPLNAVLDQEDLLAQGIEVTTFIRGATTNVDALGSCTANAFTSHFSTVAESAEVYLAWAKASSLTDTKGLEIAAIRFYNGETDATGDPSTEWPPTDCGSSGPYIFQYAQRLGLVKSQKVVSGAQNIVSALQTNSLLMGSPWLNAWMEPVNGFIDGNGSTTTLEAQIKGGVAGGHETVPFRIEKLVLSATGVVEPEKTILVGRNSWTKSWGDEGCYLVHLSTLVTLGQFCDFRQFAA